MAGISKIGGADLIHLAFDPFLHDPAGLLGILGRGVEGDAGYSTTHRANQDVVNEPALELAR